MIHIWSSKSRYSSSNTPIDIPHDSSQSLLSSFEYPFDIIFIFVIPLCFILAFLTFYVVSKTFNNLYHVIYFIIPILIITFIFFYSPAIMLIFSILIAGISLFIQFYPFKYKKDYRNVFYDFLFKIHILSFFVRLHSLVYYRMSALNFFFLMHSAHLLGFFYVLFSRYYLYYTIASPRLFSYLCLTLILIGIFTCLSAFILKLFINISNILIFNIKLNNSSLWANILLTDPYLDGDQVNPPKSPVSNSIFSFHRHINRYNLPPNRFSAWQKAGFTVGVCTLAVGCVAAYYSYNSYLQAQRSADAAQQSVDLAEVNAGIRTRESYEKKYPDSSRK
jgi:hypothetical protein